MLLRFLRHLRDDYVLATLNDCEDARASELEAKGRVEVAKQAALVTLLAIGCLMVVRFAGNEADTSWASQLLSFLGLKGASSQLVQAMDAKNPDSKLWRRVWWAAFRVLGYGVIPALLAPRLLSMRASDLGARAGDLRRHVKVYFGLFCLMMPVIFAASFGAGFQAKYPYYNLAKGEPLWPRFVLWELLYAANFAALEFFFRGFLVHAMRPRLGYGAIFAMMIPYAMIHFGKPLPEAIGSVLTGFVLGTLSVKHKSIWGGVFLHVSAACSMDFYSLWHRGLLF